MSMTRLLSSTLLASALWCAPWTSSEAQEIPVTGRLLEVRLGSGEQYRGELIEAVDGAVLLWAETGFYDLVLDDADRVRVQRHGMTGSKLFAWIGIGGLVTGLGMAAACSQVEGTDCGGVLPAMVLSWGLVGGLFALGMSGSRWADMPPHMDGLAAYARFPQGAPTGFRREREGRPPPNR